MSISIKIGERSVLLCGTPPPADLNGLLPVSNRLADHGAISVGELGSGRSIQSRVHRVCCPHAFLAECTVEDTLHVESIGIDRCAAKRLAQSRSVFTTSRLIHDAHTVPVIYWRGLRRTLRADLKIKRLLDFEAPRPQG